MDNARICTLTPGSQERIKAVDDGMVTGVSYNDVMREADQRLAP